MLAFKRLAYIFSPCSIVAILLGLGIIASFSLIHKTVGWSIFWILFLLPAIVVVFIADRLMKYFIKTVGKLWICQTIFLLVAFGILYMVEA